MEELLQDVLEEVKEVCRALHEYEGYKPKKGKAYEEGWNDAIEQVSIELLGRKSEDEVELMKTTLGLDNE